MKQRLLLIWFFYQTFSVFTGLISVVSWAIVSFPMRQHFWRFLPLYILVKVFTDALVWYYSRKYNPNRMFFFSNLGISEAGLFLPAFALDMILFFILAAAVNFIII